MRFFDSVFSDRRRSLKACACAALLALLGLGYIPWSRSEGPTFAKIIRNPSGWPGALVGPEHLQVESTGQEELVLTHFGTPLSFRFPQGPEAAPVRESAARLGPGDWVSTVAIHLDGLSFEALRLRRDPYRKLKFILSGAAALAALALVPIHYRWSKGALRPRREIPGAGPPEPGKEDPGRA